MEQTKEARKIKRQLMIDNKLSLYNTYMSAGREFLHDILEVYTSPKILFEKVKTSRYYSSLNADDRQTLEVVNEENSFSELEIDLAFELLKRFTSIKTPKCEWCEDCLKYDIDFSHEGENLEIFMNIWKNVVCKSNFISEEKFSEYTGVLWNVAENFCRTFACGKRLKDMLEYGLFQNQKRPNNIHLLSHGKQLNIQIGDNNKTFLKMEVFDHVGPASRTEKNDMSSEELVKMTLHLHPTSSSGISIARIEERFLLSLCGRKLEELNEILKERFGVEIIVTRKGCIVLILRKIDNSQWFFETFSRLEMFLKDVFMFVTSVDVLSGLICSLDITRTQEVEKSSTISDKKSKMPNKGEVLGSTILVNERSGTVTHNHEICASNQQNAEYPGLNEQRGVDFITTQQKSTEFGSNQRGQCPQYHQHTCYSPESNQHHIRCFKLSKQYHNYLKMSSEPEPFQQCNTKLESNLTNTNLCRSFRQNIVGAVSIRNQDKITETFQPNNSGLAPETVSGLLHANNNFILIDQYHPCKEYIHTNTDGQPRSDARELVNPNFNVPGHMPHWNSIPGLFQTNMISPKFSQPRSDAPNLICPKGNNLWSNVNYFSPDKDHAFQCTRTDAKSPPPHSKEIVIPEKGDSKSYDICMLLRWAYVLLVIVLFVLLISWNAVNYRSEKPEGCIKNRAMMMTYQRSLWEAKEKSEFQLGISAKFSKQKERLTVRYMNMGWKGLDDIDLSFLENFPEMEVLDISYNKMQYITLNSSLPNLKVIVMQSNILQSFQVLKRLPSLRVISLRCNRIRHISTDTFSKLPRLEFLDLSFNPITRINFDSPLLKFIPNLLQDKNEKVFTTCGFDVQNQRDMMEILTEKRDSKLPLKPKDIVKQIAKHLGSPDKLF